MGEPTLAEVIVWIIHLYVRCPKGQKECTPKTNFGPKTTTMYHSHISFWGL